MAIVKNPSSLKDKVGNGKGIDPYILQRAEKAVESLQRRVDFGKETAEYLMQLNACFDQAEARPDHCAPFLQKIFDTAHELRGQGATFEFPMISRICASLCRFTDSRDGLSDKGLDITRMHIQAINRIIRDNIRGDKHMLGQQIMDGLDYLSQKHKGRAEEA